MTTQVGETRLFRRATWVSLPGSPGWLVLLALGWTIEAVDERYWSVLMSHDDSVEAS